MTLSNEPQGQGWKTRTYTLGLIAGGLFGLISAYLYTRAAEEDALRGGGKPQPVSTAQLIGLLLAALGLIRQISEAGKPARK